MESNLLSRNEIASVYIMKNRKGSVETVVSTPEGKRKFVLILSTLFGCPVKCSFCDASLSYRGKLSTEELMKQIDRIVEEYTEEYISGFNKFKLQFSRMGEPAFNMNVINAMEEVIFKYPLLNPVLSLSTICPSASIGFFNAFENLTMKYGRRNSFQIQFSVHSTDQVQRDNLIPVEKMTFKQMNELGKRLSRNTGKKVLLNFALHRETILDSDVLKSCFSNKHFIVKLTPVNPTETAGKNNISITDNRNDWQAYNHIKQAVEHAGFDIIDSPGNFGENEVKSNCGQYIAKES